jgi:hypothetical protein
MYIYIYTYPSKIFTGIDESHMMSNISFIQLSLPTLTHLTFIMFDFYAIFHIWKLITGTKFRKTDNCNVTYKNQEALCVVMEQII